MRPIERMDLIDRVARELQRRMTYIDIDAYLPQFGVDCSKTTSNTNSKWVYVKELLGNEDDQIILRVASDLGIDHGFSTSSGRDVSAAKSWKRGYFRLFLSHVSSFKEKAVQLQSSLLPFGISGFVAHEDIEPTAEWQDEIEKALLSMDALAAILSEGFHESSWTDQEVGAAIGRELLVIGIRRGMEPYGFIGKYQGMPTRNRTVRQVAAELFRILASHRLTRARMADVLVELSLTETREDRLGGWIKLLHQFPSIPYPQLDKMRRNALSNYAISSSTRTKRAVEELLSQHDVEGPLIGDQDAYLPTDGQPPF